MGLFAFLISQATALNAGIVLLGIIPAFILYRIIYMNFVHPLSNFPGPWYLASTSLASALIAYFRQERKYVMYLVRKYGTDRPIRIAPTMLLFPRPSALKDIYWDPKCNQKSTFYGVGVLAGGPTLFTTLNAQEHRHLRKALSNAPWTVGQLKRIWEPRFDDLINLFISKIREDSAANRATCISDRLAGFASDIMSMISFTEPFGSVQNQRDEKQILENWRYQLDWLSVVFRFRFLREDIARWPLVGAWLLPTMSDSSGMGWLIREADRQIREREKLIEEKAFKGEPDFMQHALDVRFPDGTPLTDIQKRCHATLLIQAGADTTGTALGSTMRFLLLNPPALIRCRQELARSEIAGYLSNPIQYEETRAHLPFFTACIKESLRCNPPASSFPVRLVPPGGAVIDGHFVPGGMEITSYGYMVHMDKELYGEDAEEWRPERWLESEERAFELEAKWFVFGAGARNCIGKDIAMMELCKVLPELVRRFDVELVSPGTAVTTGMAGWIEGFVVRFMEREVVGGVADE